MLDPDTTRVCYIWSEELQQVSDQLPANLGRSSRVHSLIRALDLIIDDRPYENITPQAGSQPTGPSRKAFVVEPDDSLATEEWLKRYHDDAYVEYLMKNADPEHVESSDDSSGSESSYTPRKRWKTTYHGLEYDCPTFPALPRYAKLVPSATSTACRLLAQGSANITIHWDGGRHHAMRNRASGFCYVADVVLGIMLLTKEGVPRPVILSSIEEAESDKRKKRKARVMYLDLDLHYGDGVAQAFLSPSHYPPTVPGMKTPRPPQILTLSIHHSSPIFFPPASPHSGLTSADTKHPFTLSIPLSAYPTNSTYASIWPSVERVQKAFDPDYVVLQLGTDGLAGDRIGQYGAWNVDGEGGMMWCVRKVMEWGKGLCVLGGGGYEHVNAARAWALATGVLLGRDMASGGHVPDHEFWPEYKPSFTLEVPESHARDENDEASLERIDQTFEALANRIASIIKAHA